jgi:hypothetical protein
MGTAAVDILVPTATITNRHDPKSNPLYPYGKTADEDRDHVLKCVHITKVAWRKHFIISLQKRCTGMKTREMPARIPAYGVQA